MTCAMAMRGVSASEKLLLLALANYADENMACYPSQKRLADDTALSDRTIRSLLAKLEDRGIVSRKEDFRRDGSRKSDIITLHFAGWVEAEAISGGAETISGGVRKSLPGGAEMVSGLTTFEPVNEPVSGTLEASPRKRGSRFVPTDWSPKPAHAQKAQTLGLDLHEQAEAFRDFEFRDPKQDFDLAFHRWLRNAKKFSHDRPDRFTAQSDHLAAIGRAMAAACERPEGAYPDHRGGPEPDEGMRRLPPAA